MKDSVNMSPPSNVIVIVAIVTGLSLLGDSMLYIALPIYWEEIGLDSIWQVGILLSVNRFVRLPFNPIISWIYNRITLKTGIAIAIILGTITTLGYGVLKGFVAWVILRGLWGIAWSFFRIGGLSSVAYYADENHRGEAMGRYNGIYRLGNLFGMLLGGIFVPVLGLETISIIFGCLSLIGLPILMNSFNTGFLSKVETVNRGEKLKDISVQSMFQHKIIIVVSGLLITMLIQGVFTSTLSAVIERNYGHPINLFGFIISVTLLSGMIQAARYVWEPFFGRKVGLWSDGRHGRIPIYSIALLFAGLTFGFISSNLPISLWIVITLLWMLGATAISTLTDAIALDVAKSSNVISFLTVYSVALDIGAALGPIISFMLLEQKLGFTYLYWGGTGLFIALSIVWIVPSIFEKSSIKRAEKDVKRA